LGAAGTTLALVHEIKYDGSRLRVERAGKRERLITKGGYDWTKRFPWIVHAAQSQFVIDGEAVVLAVDSRSDFNAARRAKPGSALKLVRVAPRRPETILPHEGPRLKIWKTRQCEPPGSQFRGRLAS
jgi:hypothetical protein